ncbi:MAG: acyl-CoA dehydrogenase [Phycisphaerales bacterium]|nr:acyl-CoA dehydrogenase [Phycisphaerales bacterium]
MNRSTTDNDRMFIDAVRNFARGNLLDPDRRADADESSMLNVLPAVADMGLMHLVVPDEFGGLGASMRLYATLIEEISYASPSVAVTLSVHSMVGKVLVRYASDEMKRRLLPGWGRADSLAAFAISEADAGSDASSAKTAAVKVAGGYRVTGSKMWITNGRCGKWYLVLVRAKDRPSDEGKLTALVIDGQSNGIERDDIHGKMGIRGSETVVLHLNDVFVPESNRLCAEGDGLKACLAALDEGRIGIAAQAAGIAAACLDEMTSYARQRMQFGKPIGHFQAVQNMIADSAVELESSRLLIQRAAALIDAGQKATRQAAMAKLYASEAANRIAYRAVQVHGGSGYIHECRVEQLYRDARITTIYEGTSEIQRHVIARELIHSGVE